MRGPGAGEQGAMERKEHPWSGCAGLGSGSPWDGPGLAAASGSQLLLGAWQDRALLHTYFIASSLADLQGCCLAECLCCWGRMELLEPRSGWMGSAASALEMTQHPHLYSLLLELVAAAIAPSTLAAWHLYGFSGWCIGAVRGCGFPSIPRSLMQSPPPPSHSGTTNLRPGLCGGGHSAELGHKSWVFTAAAFLAALPSYHRLYYIFISLPMLIPVFIPWCSACLCWQMTSS